MRTGHRSSKVNCLILWEQAQNSHLAIRMTTLLDNSGVVADIDLFSLFMMKGLAISSGLMT